MSNMIRSVATVFNWKSFTKLEVKFRVLAAAAGMVVLGCSLIGFGARFGWLFELTSHFRLQYAIFLFVLGAAFALHKAILPAAVAECIAGWTGPAILLGDLNTTPYSPYFGRLLRTARLHDSARGFGPHGTWPEFPAPSRIPLDHCLISKDFVVLDRKIGPRLGSDHLPLMIHLSLPSR